jgi:hypothetical protein
MNSRRNRPGVAGPLILIAIGVLLLLNQMGRLPWDIWMTLWRFWPVIFILIGVDILVGASRSTLVYVVGLLLALVIIGGSVAYIVWQGGVAPVVEPAAGTETIAETLQDADSGRITLRPGVARLQVGALKDSVDFAEGQIEYSQYSLQVEKQYSVTGGRATLSLRARGKSGQFWSPRRNNVGERWDLSFTSRVPLEISIDSGVGSVSLDLSELKVTQLDVNAGVGTTTITFPNAAGLTKASIDGGVGSITVRIPSNVGVRMRVSRGIGSVNLGRRMVHSGNEYTSENYATAEYRLELDINVGIGSVSVE